MPAGDPYRTPGALATRPTLTIRWRTTQHRAWLAIPWLLIWWGVIVAALVGGAHPLLLSFHIAVGLFFLYTSLGDFFNRTTVVATPDGLHSRTRPFPRRRGASLDARHILQLAVAQVSATKNEAEAFAVRVFTHAGDRELFRTDNREDARALEQRLETYLGIEDIQRE